MQVDVIEEGLQVARDRIDREIRAFQRQQRVQMSSAVNLLRKEVRSRVKTTFGHDDSRFRDIAGKKVKSRSGKGKGSFQASVGRKIEGRHPELVGRVLLTRRAYYAVHETGAVIVAKGINTTGRRLRFRQRTLAKRGFSQERQRRQLALLVFPNREGTGLVAVRQVRIPARPVFGPAATAKGPEAVQIVGNSYDVFGPGGAR